MFVSYLYRDVQLLQQQLSSKKGQDVRSNEDVELETKMVCVCCVSVCACVCVCPSLFLTTHLTPETMPIYACMST